MGPVRKQLSRLTRVGVQMLCLGVALSAPFAGAAERSPQAASASRRLPQGYRPRHLQARWNPQAPASPSGATVTSAPPSTGLSSTIQPVQATTGESGGHQFVEDVRTQSISRSMAHQGATASPATPESGAGQPIVSQPVEPMPTLGSPFDAGQNWEEPVVAGSPGCTDGCGSCNDCTNNDQCGVCLLPGLSIDHFSIFGGVHGAKNSSNRGLDSSFGFQEGFNLGTSAKNIVLPSHCGLQFGMMAAQSNLGGAGFTLQERNQIFLTTGAFRRADYGLQGGLVVDYMWDDWYYDLQVGQIRGELSMAISQMNSYGFWFATGIDDETAEGRIFGDDVVETWETMDIYSIFYRTNLIAGGSGEAKLFAGLTGGSDGIIGAQSRLPLNNGFALESSFTYLIPDETTGFGANEVESWNVAINLAWYPGSLACGNCFRYHRPLFDVADNGSMILRRRN